MKILEIGPGQHPRPEATVRIDAVPNPNANYIMNAEKMTFDSASFDSVLMFECLEHTYNPLQILREIHRVLKTGGILTLSIPNVYYYRLFLRWAVKGKVSASPEHLWNWSLWEISKLLELAGFHIVMVEMYNEDWNNKRSVFYQLFPRIAAHSILLKAMKIE